MSFVESLTFYTESQKLVAYGFVVSGLLLLVAAAVVLVLSSGASSLWQGFKWGSIVFGLLILAGGIGYLNFCDKTHNGVVSAYQADPDSTLLEEDKRMQKVLGDFPRYQIWFSAIVLLSLAAIVFAKPFWAGVAFPIAFLHVGILLIEAHSKTSIDSHAQAVVALTAEKSE